MIYLLLGILVFLLVFLVNTSTTVNYVFKISFFYFTIFLHGFECMVTLIPGYFRMEGATLIFREFYYWCFWTRINVDVRGADLMEAVEGPAVVVVNHQSSIDVVSMSSVFPKKCVVMMKRQLGYIPFFNISAYLAHSIFINRTNKEKALQAVDYCVEKMKERDMKLWIFPEGTRNRKGGLLPFKKGAFNIAVRAQIPIIPIVLSDYKPFYSKNGKYFHPGGEIIAQVLPAISTTGKTLEDVVKLADDTRETMLSVYEKISNEAKEKFEAKQSLKSE